MSKPELFASTDCETNGPIPLRYSMLSLGTAVFTLEKELVATFYRTLKPLPEASEDPDTMAWWAKHPDAWAATLVDQRDAAEAMRDYADWCADLNRTGQLTFLAMPGLFDGTFVRVYATAFAPGGDPYGHSGGWCLRNVAATHLGIPFHQAGEKSFPAPWRDGAFPPPHHALHDAASQGAVGVNAIRATRGLPHIPAVTVSCGYRPPGFGTDALPSWTAADAA